MDWWYVHRKGLHAYDGMNRYDFTYIMLRLYIYNTYIQTYIHSFIHQLALLALHGARWLLMQ